jgi:adenosylcobinamide-GDP ribazoletransferase
VIKAGIGFFTTIPTSSSLREFEVLSRHIYLFPFFGLIIGAALGASGYLLLSIALPPQISAILLICLLYLITGINHLDGLADFGDGIAAQGTKEEKIAILRDPRIGAGGVLLCILIILILFSALLVIAALSALLLFKLMVLAETAAKLSLVIIIVLGKSTHKGFGSIMIEHAKKRDLLAALAFSAIISYIALNIYGIAILFISAASALIVLSIANRNFGGVSGDAMGASNEISRSIALITGALLCARY